MTAPLSFKVPLPGRTINLLQWGDPAGPVVMLVHGIRDHAFSWEPIALALSGNLRVLAMDLRGHGDSDWCQAYNLHDHARDLAGVVAALDLPRFALVGHSLGGHIALRFAATFPERLACLCSIEGVEMPIMRDQRLAPRSYAQRLREWIDKEADRELRQPRIYPSLAEAQARMAREHPDIDGDTLALITRHGMVPAPGGYRWKYDNAARNRAPEDAHGRDVDELLQAITCPVLLAYGEASWIPLPPPERLARLRDRHLVTFPGAGHWLHQQSRPSFIAALRAFLAAHGPQVQSERTTHA